MAFHSLFSIENYTGQTFKYFLLLSLCRMDIINAWYFLSLSVLKLALTGKVAPLSLSSKTFCHKPPSPLSLSLSLLYVNQVAK